MAVIINFANHVVTTRDLDVKVLIKLIQKNRLKSLLTFMNTIFIPCIMNE
jgi:hypothetical protein